MKRIYTICAFLIGIALLLSNSANPPNGKTGAPGDGICSECHSLGTGMQDGTIEITGFPAVIEPNVTYPLTITNSNPNGLAVRGGFQVTILNSSNQKAGDFVAGSNDPNSAFATFNMRQYWEHDPSLVYPPSNMVSWTASWKAPTGPPNTTITWYAAANIANGNGLSSGDLIIENTGAGMLNGGGDPLDVDITSNNVLCNGGNTGSATAIPSGGFPPYVYAWSNGGNTATINNLFAGTYTVTVTDNVPGTSTASVVITQPTLIVLQPPVITPVSCFGGNNGAITANATGGVPPYIFNWSNGDTGNSNTGLTAGNYTVTVTDDNGCTKMATYTVTQPPLIVINLLNLTHESCAGEEDGSITISVSGGVPPMFAEWSNGFVGFSNTGLEPGAYSVTVTDNNDCTKTASYTVNPGGTVTVTLQQITHVTCNGGNNGSITVAASGGTSPYTYAWSNGGSGPTINNLTAGNYIVTTSDANGCEVVNAYAVTQPPAITVQINAAGQNVCFGDSIVDLTAVATGQQPPFTGSWSNGVQGLTNPNVPAGTYTVTVTDNTGCTKTASTIVTSPPELTLNVVTTDETSAGANNGTATANPSGGSPGYTYLWSNSGTTQTITGLAPGSYTVTVTDMNGCTVVGSGQVDAFGCTLSIVLGADQSICEDDTITITPAVTGANGTTTYLWSDGSTGPTLQVSSGGEYCVSITDMTNCQDVDCVIITEDDFPEILCPVMNESGPGLNDGAISCDGVPGIVTYLWSNGATTSTITGLAPGEYCVTMTNTAGCTDSQCFLVQPGDCQLTITATVTDALCFGDANGSILVTVNNATAPVAYAWSNGNTTANPTSLAAGSYTVTITDAAGCGEIQTYSVGEPAALSITVDSVASISDTGPGAISITASGGTVPYTFLWTDPSGDQIPGEDLSNLLEPGYYSVNLTDGHGCTTVLDSILVEMDVAVSRVQPFKELKVYPVPADDVLIIDLEEEITDVFISGADGRLYKRIANPPSNHLQVGDLEPGWYIIRITDGESWYIARMVK